MGTWWPPLLTTFLGKMNPGTRLSATKVSLNPQNPGRLDTQRNADSNTHKDRNSIAAWDSQCGIFLVVGSFFLPCFTMGSLLS